MNRPHQRYRQYLMWYVHSGDNTSQVLSVFFFFYCLHTPAVERSWAWVVAGWQSTRLSRICVQYLSYDTVYEQRYEYEKEQEYSFSCSCSCSCSCSNWITLGWFSSSIFHWSRVTLLSVWQILTDADDWCSGHVIHFAHSLQCLWTDPADWCNHTISSWVIVWNILNQSVSEC